MSPELGGQPLSQALSPSCQREGSGTALSPPDCPGSTSQSERLQHLSSDRGGFPGEQAGPGAESSVNCVMPESRTHLPWPLSSGPPAPGSSRSTRKDLGGPRGPFLPLLPGSVINTDIQESGDNERTARRGAGCPRASRGPRFLVRMLAATWGRGGHSKRSVSPRPLVPVSAVQSWGRAAGADSKADSRNI